VQKAIHFANDVNEIQLLANFKHREILQLLSEHPMTQTQLSHRLGLTKSAIAYHLKQLMQAQLIYIKKVEVEDHGIQQKFYSPIANFIIAMHHHTPDNLKRYFIQMQIEHMIGIIAALQSTSTRCFEITPEIMENLATLLWKQLEHSCKTFENHKAMDTAEHLKIAIYTDALSHLIKTSAWTTLLRS
jgi:predicted transcriptional regulator